MISKLISMEAASIFSEVLAHRRHLHQHPELSFLEQNTSDYVCRQLAALDIPFKRMCDTGIVAHLSGRDGARVIALRADMDALPIQEENPVDYASANPGVMHACGHDVHTASLLGVANVLVRLRDHWSGTVKLIFQPGEEKLPGGASLMVKAGALEEPRPEMAFAQHVFPELESGKVGFRSGSVMASADEIYLTVKGRGGHAALAHRLIDPVLIASHILVALQQVVSRRALAFHPSVLSFGKIEAKGATNVLPDEVHVAGTFRTFDEGWRKEAHRHIREIAQGMAKAMGGSCDVEIPEGYPHVFNDEHTTRLAREAAIELLGAEKVVEIEPRMTGEDFAFIAREVPGCFYRLGTRAGADGVIRGLHTSTFDVEEKSMETGVALLSAIAVKALHA